MDDTWQIALLKNAKLHWMLRKLNSSELTTYTAFIVHVFESLLFGDFLFFRRITHPPVHSENQTFPLGMEAQCVGYSTLGLGKGSLHVFTR